MKTLSKKYVFIMMLVCLPFLLIAKQPAAERLQTITDRFAPPAGFERLPVDSSSFGHWLRQLTLKPENSAVHDFRGRIFKSAEDTTVAALTAINVSGRNLEQCMDILLRLRAEYLIDRGLKEQVVFPLPDGRPLSWKDWKRGKRPHFKGLHFTLQKQASSDSSQKNFHKYLDTIYEYSGSQTFYHHYRDIPADSVRIGDFIVRKQRKGHAVIILDLARDKNGRLRALIGQGDTPACPLYLLSYRKGDPWFPLDSTIKILPLPIRKKMSWDGLRRFP